MSVCSLNLADDVTLAESFRSISLEDIPDMGCGTAKEVRLNRRTKLVARLLHCKRPDSTGKFRYTRPGDKRGAPRVSADINYDRWYLLMEVASGQPFIVITRDQQETRNFNFYSDWVTVGGAYCLLQCSGHGKMENGTRVLLTSNPLIPIKVLESPDILPQCNEYSVRFHTFHLGKCNVELLDLGVVRDTCPGHLCDGKSTKLCGCHRVLPKNAWVVRAKVSIQQLGEDEEVEISGFAFSKLFIDETVLQEEAKQVRAIDIWDVADRICDYINALPNAWRAIGWYKAGVTTGATGDQGVQQRPKFHLVRLEPASLSVDNEAWIHENRYRIQPRGRVVIERPDLAGPYVRDERIMNNRVQQGLQGQAPHNQDRQAPPGQQQARADGARGQDGRPDGQVPPPVPRQPPPPIRAAGSTAGGQNNGPGYVPFGGSVFAQGGLPRNLAQNARAEDNVEDDAEDGVEE
ncbi:hypothetical protein FOZ63_024988 [Perkinsus olseni]|uniref:Uncharacterized protein n=2 Tax=Perkinsus olseni TaxID=32597 RepID=A0A7J6PS88_PEROL|nr:hypothetical protein FOZ63_024988 [Perkinsus olseni]